MKTKILLDKENSNTLYVGDVDVNNGVYAKTGNLIAYWIDSEMCFIRPTDKAKNSTHYDSFEHAVECWTRLDLWQVFTLDGRKITTERQLTVYDLLDSNNVAWVHPSGQKGYIVYLGAGEFKKLPSYTNSDSNTVCNVAYNSGETFKSISLAAKNVCDYTEMFVFDTRKEMYQWLAE